MGEKVYDVYIVYSNNKQFVDFYRTSESGEVERFCGEKISAISPWATSGFIKDDLIAFSLYDNKYFKSKLVAKNVRFK